MKPNSWCVARAHRASFAVLLLLLLLLPTALRAEPVTLKHAVELALKHATTSGIAAADEQRAFANYRELHNSYIPQVTAGAGLGWSYGFPLSLEGAAPSMLNINAQSPLYHFELKDFLGAARAETAGASLHNKDQRNQVIQDTVLSYAELQKWEQRLARLRETEADAQKMQAAVAQRVKEGIDSELESTRARLSAARVHLRVTEAEGAADVLRARLSKLTRLPPSSIQTENDSLPALPTASDPAARSQVSEETLRLQHGVSQMQAARDVAQLEFEIAQKTLEAVQTRMDSGGTVTLHDLDDARAQASERFISLQDVTFELERAQVGLLRATGDLEGWALRAP